MLYKYFSKIYCHFLKLRYFNSFRYNWLETPCRNKNWQTGKSTIEIERKRLACEWDKIWTKVKLSSSASHEDDAIPFSYQLIQISCNTMTKGKLDGQAYVNVLHRPSISHTHVETMHKWHFWPKLLPVQVRTPCIRHPALLLYTAAKMY